MNKILVIGSNGMAGHVVYRYLKSQPNLLVSDIARQKVNHDPSFLLDVTNFADLERVISSGGFHVIINCIGILNDDAVKNPDKAILVNAYLPHFLSKLAKKSNFRVIHISTDCVFSGAEGNYTEISERNGIGVYAQTKALGELNDDRNLTIRTSIIGPELKQNGIGLFHWFLNQKDSIPGFTQAYWSGVTTYELAKTLVKIIQMPELTGLIHLTNNTRISKNDLLQLFKVNFEKDIEIVPSGDHKVDKSLINTRRDVPFTVPNYSEMVSEMRNWMILNRNLYPHYHLD